MKKNARQLKLHRETLRALTHPDLAQPAGGVIPTHLCVITRNGFGCHTYEASCACLQFG